MPQPRVDCVLEARNILGEGPVWDRRDDRLYWVDIRAPALLSFDPATGRTAQWPMPAVISCAVPRAAGGFLLALQTGLHGFDPGTGKNDFNIEAQLPAEFVALLDLYLTRYRPVLIEEPSNWLFPGKHNLKPKARKRLAARSPSASSGAADLT